MSLSKDVHTLFEQFQTQFEDIQHTYQIILKKFHEHEDRIAKTRDSEEKISRIHFPSKIKLDVGGRIFSVSLDTLRVADGSFFYVMFSGNYSVMPGDDGSYFIDRNPAMFDYILDFLRGTPLMLDDLTRRERHMLIADAEYYNLPGLLETLMGNWEWDLRYSGGYYNFDGQNANYVSGNWSVARILPAISEQNCNIKVILNMDYGWFGIGDTRMTNSEFPGYQNAVALMMCTDACRFYGNNMEHSRFEHPCHRKALEIHVDLHAWTLNITVEKSTYHQPIPEYLRGKELYFCTSLSELQATVTILP